jgi:hypothetical protein
MKRLRRRHVIRHFLASLLLHWQIFLAFQIRGHKGNAGAGFPGSASRNTAESAVSAIAGGLDQSDLVFVQKFQIFLFFSRAMPNHVEPRTKVHSGENCALFSQRFQNVAKGTGGSFCRFSTVSMRPCKNPVSTYSSSFGSEFEPFRQSERYCSPFVNKCGDNVDSSAIYGPEFAYKDNG